MLFRTTVNHLCTSQVRTKATLPPLAFEYKDLEPTISREIMEIHHQKHHNTYVVNYNNTLEKLQTAVSKGNRINQSNVINYMHNLNFYLNSDDTATIISLAPALKFNGGGHINHSIFWETLTPKSTKLSGKVTINKC